VAPSWESRPIMNLERPIVNLEIARKRNRDRPPGGSDRK